MLVFLFVMVYCGIRKYHNRVKIVKPFEEKIVQSMYCLFIAIHSHDCANINDKYIYIDPLAIVKLQAKAKITDHCKAQMASNVCSQYHNRQYPKTDRASLRPI